MLTKDIPIPDRFTKADIAEGRVAMLKVLKEHPDLTYAGHVGGKRDRIGKRTSEEAATMLTDRSIVEFLYCKEWLLALAPFNKVASVRSPISYRIKHWMEGDSPWGYVSNGTCIAAVYGLGIPSKPVRPDSYNVFVALSESAICAWHRTKIDPLLCL
jgi:hypothetical protein